MSVPTTVLMASQELKETAGLEPDYVKRVDAVMRAARGHWLIVNEEEQFKAACGALLLAGTEEERADINAQLRGLRNLNALLSGVPIDVDAMLAEQEAAPAPKVMLAARWRELKDE